MSYSKLRSNIIANLCENREDAEAKFRHEFDKMQQMLFMCMIAKFNNRIKRKAFRIDDEFIHITGLSQNEMDVWQKIVRTGK